MTGREERNGYTILKKEQQARSIEQPLGRGLEKTCHQKFRKDQVTRNRKHLYNLLHFSVWTN